MQLVVLLSIVAGVDAAIGVLSNETSVAGAPMPRSNGASVGAPSASLLGSGAGKCEEWLQATNGYRKCHGAPAVEWDADLAAQAAAWVHSNGCQMEHSNAYESKIPAGENLAKGSFGSPAIANVVKAWYSEVEACGCTSFSSGTGHFTALVWKSVTHIGCYTRTDCSSPLYICQYRGPTSGSVNGAPNMQGEYVENVQVDTTGSCAADSSRYTCTDANGALPISRTATLWWWLSAAALVVYWL